jgi:hypothetical protein
MNADESQFNADYEDFFGEKDPEQDTFDNEYDHPSKHIKLDTPLLNNEKYKAT